jgi:hypothetical protein
MSDQSVPITKIGLSKLFLWMEAERIESYPEAFGKLQAGQVYTKDFLINKVFGLIYNDQSVSNQPVRSDFLRNLFGLEKTSLNKISIRGVNALIEVERGKYIPSPSALKIGEAYLKQDKSIWLPELAKMIASHEVRTRLLLYLLGKGGYRLVFPNNEFFGFQSSHAELVNDREVIPLFTEDSKNFNKLLQQYSRVTLGKWWTEIIHIEGLEISSNFTYEGLRDPKPPTNKLNSRIKISMNLMKYLDILVNQGEEWVVNPVQATAIFGEEIAQDFIEIAYDHNPIQYLKQWKTDFQDALGFVVVADLVQRWGEYKMLNIAEAERDFDDWMRHQIYQGRVRILETHAGQPRLGRGLFGDDTARKIRFDMIEA